MSLELKLYASKLFLKSEGQPEMRGFNFNNEGANNHDHVASLENQGFSYHYPHLTL